MAKGDNLTSDVGSVGDFRQPILMPMPVMAGGPRLHSSSRSYNQGLAEEIRQRCNSAMQKITSLRIVVNERNLQYREMTAIEGNRPKTAFMSTPKYILTLFDAISSNVREIKQLYENGLANRSVPKQDKFQLLGLIADLERELGKISDRLEIQVHPSTINNPMDNNRLPKIMGNSTEAGTVSNDDENIILKLENIKIHSSIFPYIPTSSADAETRIAEDTRMRSQARTMTLRLEMTKHSSRTTFVQKSVQGYPYGSCFPTLAPWHPKRRKVCIKRDRVETNSDVSKTVGYRQTSLRKPDDMETL